MQKSKFLLKLTVLAFFTILAVSCENPLEDRVDDLEAEQARQQEVLDSLYEVQLRYVDSLYAFQQEMIEEFLSTIPNSEFTDVEVFSGSCPADWEALNLSEVTGKKKSLVILRVDRLTPYSNSDIASNNIVFRPNGDTTEWYTYSDQWIGMSNSLSVIGFGRGETGLAMLYTDDEGVIEMRRNPVYGLEVSIKVEFYFNYN